MPNRTAYAYVTRYLSTSPISSMPPGDPEHFEARRLFTSLVPFLTDRKSKIALPSLSSLITHLWSRFEPVSTSYQYVWLMLSETLHIGNYDTVVLRSTHARLRKTIAPIGRRPARLHRTHNVLRRSPKRKRSSSALRYIRALRAFRDIFDSPPCLSKAGILCCAHHLDTRIYSCGAC